MVRVDPKNVGRELEENQAHLHFLAFQLKFLISEHDISSEGDESFKTVSDGDNASKTVSDGNESSETSSNGDESAEENDILLIPERETSVDLSQYSLRKELEDEDHFDGLVSILSRWDVVKIIQYYLEKENVYNQFMNSCFGCLSKKVNLENWNKIFCGQIVHYLLQRRVVSLKKKEVWFIIDGKPIRFGMKEFAMITGLNCGKVSTSKALYDEGKAKDFLDLVLNKKSSLTGNDLKEILKSDRVDAQTKLKIAMVWFVESFLWAADQKRTVDIKNMKMVTNLDYFNAYPWGGRSFEMTVEFLLNVNLKKQSAEWKENNSTSKGYSLQGFPWAFMVWAFEAIPILGEAFGQPLIESPLPLPRLLRWYDKKKTPLDYKTVLLTMQNKEVVVHPTLVPTNVESKKSYLINWEDLKDGVDENIDRLTKVVSGVTRLVNSSLERHEIPVAMDHDGRETDIRRQPSKGVTENINLSDSPDKLSQLIELCANMFNEMMKDMNKKLNERMDGLDAKVDHLSGIVGGLHVQVEKLSKKTYDDENFQVGDEQLDMLEKKVIGELEEEGSNMVDKDEATKFAGVCTTRAKRTRKTNPKYDSPFATDLRHKKIREASKNMKTYKRRKIGGDS